ncbi:MAG: hypothetical protein ACYCWW_00145 [Deltaproteobacteria bacterium]
MKKALQEHIWLALFIAVILGGTILAIPVHRLVCCVFSEFRRRPRDLDPNDGANQIAGAMNGGLPPGQN